MSSLVSGSSDGGDRSGESRSGLGLRVTRGVTWFIGAAWRWFVGTCKRTSVRENFFAAAVLAVPTLLGVVYYMLSDEVELRRFHREQALMFEAEEYRQKNSLLAAFDVGMTKHLSALREWRLRWLWLSTASQTEVDIFGRAYKEVVELEQGLRRELAASPGAYGLCAQVGARFGEPPRCRLRAIARMLGDIASLPYRLEATPESIDACLDEASAAALQAASSSKGPGCTERQADDWVWSETESRLRRCREAISLRTPGIAARNVRDDYAAAEQALDCMVDISNLLHVELVEAMSQELAAPSFKR